MSKANKSEKVSPDLDTPTDLPQAAVDKISASLNTLLADAFALYLKTKNFHWHVSGRHFHDYHLMLDEQSDAIFATTDQLAERVRKLGGNTLRSIGRSASMQTIQDNNEAYVPPREMLRELMEDNKHMAAAMRKAHKLADDHEDSGTAGLLEALHRRDRAPHLVPVRSQPPGRQQRGVVLPSLRANGSRECAPDDRLRDAIHTLARRQDGLLRLRSQWRRRRSAALPQFHQRSIRAQHRI